MSNNQISIQEGYRVQVTSLSDETANPDDLGKVGTVDALSYPEDIGANEPNDPYISVDFDDGTSGEFWTEELTILFITDGEAPGL